MNNFSHVPPGFRFHPTDEELVDYYLRKKVASKRIDLNVIKDVDLYKIEPWDLQEICKIGTEEQNDWYFFSHKDKKYPTGTRTNRATRAGFWKATGRDKAIYTKNCLIGMRKTLVFYKGRAPNGQKSDWIMHEYRLETNENGTISQEEGWVVCRVFKKRITAIRREGEHEALCWYDDQVPPAYFDSPRRLCPPYTSPHHHPHYSCKQELDHLPNYSMPLHHDAFLQLPQLESPKVTQTSNNAISCSSASGIPFGVDHRNDASINLPSIDEHLQQGNQQLQVINSLYGNINGDQQAVDQVTTDWRVLDKFVASQLMSQDHNATKEEEEEAAYSKGSSLQVAQDLNMLLNDPKTHEMASELASITTSSSSQVDMWK